MTSSGLWVINQVSGSVLLDSIVSRSSPFIVPCQIVTLAVTAWYKALLSASQMMSTPLVSQYLPIQPRNAFVFLYLFSFIFPVITWYSIPHFLSTCPKKLHYLFSIRFINCLSVWGLVNTFSFVTFFIQEIFIILRKNHISAASSGLQWVLLLKMLSIGQRVTQ